MPTTEEVGLRIKMENGQALKGLDQVTKSTGEMQKKSSGFMKILRSGWFQVAAAIGTAVIAIMKAIKLSKEAAYLKQINMAFESMADAAGVSAKKILESMRELSGGTISTMEMIQSANRAMILGLPIDALDQMMRIARASATATGSDVRQMFDDIVVGIGRQSRLILDNLGIIVKVEKANQEYAKAMGIVGRKLTDTEKRQAFLNAVLKEGERIIKNVGKAGQEVTSAERWQRMTAAIKDLRAEVGQMLLPAFEGVTEEIRGWSRGLEETLKNARLVREAFEEPGKAIKRLEKEYKRANKELVRWNDLLYSINDRESAHYKIVKDIAARKQETVNTILTELRAAKEYYESVEANQKRLIALEIKIGNIAKINEMYWAGYQKQADKTGRAVIEVIREAADMGDTYAQLLLSNLIKLEALDVEYAELTKAIEENTVVTKESGEAADALKPGVVLMTKLHKQLRLEYGRLDREEKLLGNTEEVRAKKASILLKVIRELIKSGTEQTKNLQYLLDTYGSVLVVEEELIETEERLIDTHQVLVDAFQKELETLKGTEEEVILLMGRYVELGLTYEEVAEALGHIGTALDKAFGEEKQSALRAYRREMASIPLDQLKSELLFAAEAGDTFGTKLVKAFINATIELGFLIVKMRLFYELEKLLGAAKWWSVPGAKKGGEVGVSVLKYARGGELPGKTGGDVNLGLFRKHEYLIPPEHVTSRTRPILNAIRTGRYERGGEVGGMIDTGLQKDIQIFNVLEKSMIMGIVDENKETIVNYIGADLLADGITRKILKGVL